MGLRGYKSGLTQEQSESVTKTGIKMTLCSLAGLAGIITACNMAFATDEDQSVQLVTQNHYTETASNTQYTPDPTAGGTLVDEADVLSDLENGKDLYCKAGAFKSIKSNNGITVSDQALQFANALKTQFGAHNFVPEHHENINTVRFIVRAEYNCDKVLTPEGNSTDRYTDRNPQLVIDLG